MSSSAGTRPTESKPEGRLLSILLLSCLAVAGLAVFFTLWNLVRPYPLEERENSGVLVTALLLQGINPYTIEQHPVYLYVYGIGYPFVVYPFAALFGPTLIVHRAVTLAAIVLNCAILFWGMRLTRVPAKLALCGSLLLFCHSAFNDIVASPNSLGVLLLFLSLVLPLRGNFGWWGICGGLLAAVLAFYAKAYFVIGAPLLISYLFFFKSKARAIAAAITFASVMTATVCLVDHLFPLYFTDVFYINYNIAAKSVHHLIHMGLRYLPFGIALIALLAWRLKHRIAEDPRPSWPPELDFVTLAKPLFSNFSLGWVTYILWGCLTVYVFKMGLHTGTDFGYIYHLLTPFLIWRCCIVAGVEFPERPRLLLYLQATAVLVAAFLVVPSIIKYQRDQSTVWRHVTDVISRHHDVLNAGALAGILHDQGKPIYDAGQAEYYPWSFDHNTNNFISMYQLHCIQFKSSLEQKVRDHSFDAIMVFSEPVPFLPVRRGLIQTFYHRVEVIPLDMTFGSYHLEIWEPNL